MVIKKGFNKKASAHLEIIMSFILFVSFTLFLIMTLEPTKKNLLEDSILFGVKNAFFDNATINVTSVLVDTSANNCPGGWQNAQNRLCKPQELDGYGNSTWISAGKDCLYYAMTSSEFNNVLTEICAAPNAIQNYSLGYIEKQQVLSNKTLQKIKEEYYQNYNASKTRLGAPAVVDFAIISTSNGFNYILDRTVPDDAEVISGVYRKRVLYENGSIINQDFIVKVW